MKLLKLLNRLFKEVEVSLWDMIFKQYEHDINVVDTFINKGMFGKLKIKLKLMID
jgi:hypothetical protein